LIATSKDRSALHTVVLKSQLFGKEIVLNSPTKTDRIDLLQGLVCKSTIPNDFLNIEEIAGRMDGYCLGDVKQFYDAVLKASTIRHIETNGVHSLTDYDFCRAFETFKPFSQTISKIESPTVEWSMIGGMLKTKELLLQTLKWPTMYPQIFEHCSLRLRSGILLYGYPGCGKTLLASAVSKECGLNFISVKGPELLNKYIGQSEKQVRDLFERARQCTPCCLFFDEFDSIAPTRGHDNSGVTDRVVNQLLTEMDGAQGLQGVYVLAATR
jgi:peroxin-1